VSEKGERLPGIAEDDDLDSGNELHVSVELNEPLA
jgi:hypothetical protein